MEWLIWAIVGIAVAVFPTAYLLVYGVVLIEQCRLTHPKDQRDHYALRPRLEPFNSVAAGAGHE